jgi:hypothetical protein
MKTAPSRAVSSGQAWPPGGNDRGAGALFSLDVGEALLEVGAGRIMTGTASRACSSWRR